MPTTTMATYWPLTSSDLAQWVSAIGTLLVVIFALFGETIHKFFFQPRLLLVVGSKAPFFEKTVEKNSVSTTGGLSKSYFGKIKIKIENLSLTTAESCKIYAEKIVQEKPDKRSYFSKKEFQPTPLFWMEKKDSEEHNVVPRIPSYLEFAQIRREETLTTSENTSGNETVKYCISLAIDDPENEGLRIKLEPGTYIVPLTIHASNLRVPITKYLYLYWDGKSPDKITTEGFTVVIMKDKEGKESVNSLE